MLYTMSVYSELKYQNSGLTFSEVSLRGWAPFIIEIAQMSCQNLYMDNSPPGQFPTVQVLVLMTGSTGL